MNNTLSYDPSSFKQWCDRVIDCLIGESSSIKICSNKFTEQMTKLREPGVWSGAAAAQNYDNFVKTHRDLLQFVNRFGLAFQEVMNTFKNKISSLENINLATLTNVESFGEVIYSNISDFNEDVVNKEVVEYKYDVILTISQELKTISSMLLQVNNSLIHEIETLNNGNKVWDGNAAQNTKETLSNILKTSMEEITNDLNICIKNIEIAAQNAKGADR